MRLNYPGSLHGHTQYSNNRIRDSINRHEDLIDYAISLGQEVIAFTEHECVSDAIKIEKYYKKIKKDNPNFKVILGNEIYLVRNGLCAENCGINGSEKFYHFILLAKDAIGHQQIRELSTRAWHRSFTWHRQTRVPTYYQDLKDIIGSNPGHVIASSACLGGFVDTKLLEYHADKNEENYEKLIKWCKNIESIFGIGNFYLELQPAKSNEQKIANRELIRLAEKVDLKYIITCDEHYLKKEDAPIHAAYLNSQDGDREVESFYATTYLMDTEELESYLDLTESELQSAYNSILEIKNKCEDYSLLKPLNIPTLRWKEQEEISAKELKKYMKLIPMLETFEKSDYMGDKALVRAIINGIKNKEDLQNKQAYKEIDSNLEMTWVSSNVNNTHWSAYFLNLQNIIEECWNAGTLVGPGRGSGVGFILLYVLDITQINPLREQTKCFSWRFLNPERVSVLDVDVDIEGGRRADVLAHLRKVYGEDRVSNVVTFGTEKSKAAIKTAARGLGIDVDEAQYLASLIPEERGTIWTLDEAYYGDEEKGYKPVSAFVREMSENYSELWNVAHKIEGLVSQIGEHAGGVIFVDEPFSNSTALMRVPNGDLVTQFDLHDAEDVSLQMQRLINT